MFALNRLKEQSLRRLYKFILKRVIGQYLESELVLEQLTVESRTGLVSLKDLRFNCKLLNELLQGMPFQIVSAEVSELQATVSYDTMLADGCNLIAKGCKIVFAPIEPPPATRGHQKHPASSNASKASSTKPDTPPNVTDQPRQGSTSSEGEDPLLFIAQWIEVVIARLKCTVEDLEVIFVSHPQLAKKFSSKTPLSDSSVKKKHYQPAVAAASVHFLFDTIAFHNTHPKMLQQDFNASTIASTSHMLGSFNQTGNSSAESNILDADISLLSFRKLLSVKSIRVEVKTHSHTAAGTFGSTKCSSSGAYLPLLHFTEGGQIEMMIQPPPQKRRSTYVNSGVNGGNSHIREGRPETGPTGLGHSQSLAYSNAALDMEITFPKLVCNLQASQAPILLAVVNSFVDGKAEQTRAFGELAKSSTIPGGGYLPLHLHNLSAEMQHLQEGLHNLHQKHTLHHLEELGAAFSSLEDKNDLTSAKTGKMDDGDGTDEVDFARLAHLLKKYQLTRELLSAEDRARNANFSPKGTSKSSTQLNTPFLGSPVESDSEVDFPSDQPVHEDKGYDYDSEEEMGSNADVKSDSDDDFDSTLFFDAAEGNSTMGKSKRGIRLVQKGTSASRDMTTSGLSQSIADSSMFHTTANVSFNPAASSSKQNASVKSSAHHNGDGGVAGVSGGSFFRLFVNSTEIIYQDDRQISQSFAGSSQNSLDDEERNCALQKHRAEGERLVLHLDTAVMTFSVPAPPVPSIPSGTGTVVAIPVPKFSASVCGIALYERICTNTVTLETDAEGQNNPACGANRYEYLYQNNVLVRLSADKVPDMSSLVIPPERGAAQQKIYKYDNFTNNNDDRSVFVSDDEDDDFQGQDTLNSRGGSLSGPQLEVHGSLSPLDPKTGKGGTVISVQFQHATSSICVATILKWIKRLEGVVEMQQEAASGFFKLDCTVNIKSLEVILLCDPGENSSSVETESSDVDGTSTNFESAASALWENNSDDLAPTPPSNPRKPRFRTDWTKVSTGLGLGQSPSLNARWKRVHSDSIYSRSGAEFGALGAHATTASKSATPPGCVRVVVVGVTVAVLSTNVPIIKSSFSLQVSSINAFLRLSSPYLPVNTPSTTFTSAGATTLQGYFHTYELGFLSMRSLGDHRISVTKSSYSTAEFEKYGQQGKGNVSSGPSNGNVQEDLSKSRLFDTKSATFQTENSTLKEFEDIVEINTQIVRADLRSLELNALIGCITGIVPTPPPDVVPNVCRGKKSEGAVKESFGNNTVKPKPPSFLAIRVFSHILSVRLAPDDIHVGFDNDNERVQRNMFSYCFSIREPQFEVVSSTTYPRKDADTTLPSQCTYLVKDLYTIAASDLSFFEIPLPLLEDNSAFWGNEQRDDQQPHNGGRGESCRGPRFREPTTGGYKGQEYHFIPLIHRTSLESAMMGSGSNSTLHESDKGKGQNKSGGDEHVATGMIGGKGRPKHRALKFTVCMMEEVTLTTTQSSMFSSATMSSSSLSVPVVSSSSLRNTSFDLCLSDMTYRFDPHSMWFQYFPEIFDPIGSTDIIPGKRSGLSSDSGAANVSDKDCESFVGPSVATINVFGRTRLSASVNKLLIDCCQPDNTEDQLLRRMNLTHKISSTSPPVDGMGNDGGRQRRHSETHIPPADSRILLSIGKVAVSSTLVTNSNRVALSANLSDASIRVSNKLVRESLPSGATESGRGGNSVGPVGRCIEQSPVDILGYYIEETYYNTSKQSTISLSDDLTIDFDSFVDVHGFVLMGTLDRCQVQIHLNTPSASLAAARQRLERERATMANIDDLEHFGPGHRESDKEQDSNVVPIGVECSAGTAALYGCADSLLVLVDGISHIVDSINATKDDRMQSIEKLNILSESDQSLSTSQLLPLPSQTALMLSPVSAIRHSFVAAEHQEKEKLQKLQFLNERTALPSVAPTVSSASSSSNANNMQKSVSFFFGSPLDSNDDIRSVGDGSGVLSQNVSRAENNDFHRAGGHRDGLVPKLQPNFSPHHTSEDNLWGDDIDECFSEVDVDESVGSLMPIKENNATIDIDAKQVATDIKAGEGLVKDPSWINDLEEGMFAPAKTISSNNLGRRDNGSSKRVVFASRYSGRNENSSDLTFPSTQASLEENAITSVREVSLAVTSRINKDDENKSPVVGGLGAAMIEEYYPEPEAVVESDDDDPEHAARFYAQYDYDDVDDNDDNLEDNGGFAYEEDDDDVGHGFEEVEENDDDIMSESELDRRREDNIHDNINDDDCDSIISSHSSSGSSSGYSECSFVSKSSDESGGAGRKSKSKSNVEDGAMWKSWGVMKSVTDLRQQPDKNEANEMREMVNMSTSAMFKTGMMDIPQSQKVTLADNDDIAMGGSTLLTVDVDTDSEGSVISELEGDDEKVVLTKLQPYMQVHSEGQVDEDHEKAWESMSFYQQVQDASMSTSLPPSSPSTLNNTATKGDIQDKAQSQNFEQRKVKSGVAEEQKAQWYNMSTIKTHQIHPLHMTEPPRDKDTVEDFVRDRGPSGDCLITPKISISVKFSVRVKLFAGQEWDIRDGDSDKDDSTNVTTMPSVSLSVQHDKSKPVTALRRGKYDNTATIEKHLGELAGQEGTGLFNKTKSQSTRTAQQSKTTKNLALKHERSGSSSIKTTYRSSTSAAVGFRSYGRKHVGVSRDKANGHTEISFSSCRVVYRLYPHHQLSHSTSAFAPIPLPTERYALRVHDMLVSYTQAGRKSKKVLGNWLNPAKPVESHLPLMEVTAAGYDLGYTNTKQAQNEPMSSLVHAKHGLEYRMEVSVLPLRCYLDGAYVSFIRGFVDYLGQQQRRQLSREKATYSRLQKHFGLVTSAEMSKKSNENERKVTSDDVEEDFISEINPPDTVLAASSGKIHEALNSSLFASDIKSSVESSSHKSHSKPINPIAAEILSNDVPTPPPLTYFQSWKVNPVELKINYAPNPLDFRALQKGDFLQLLNLLSIDSLELTLTKVNLIGVSGAASGFSKMGEEWVKEIYAHQMHRLLSSTGPLRGISSIGTSIHGLLLVPVQEYRANGAVGVLKALKRESVSLLKTVTRETLTAGSKVSHFLANTLIDLVTPEGAVPSNRRHREAGGGRAHRNEKQPTGFTDSLDRAYEAVSREVTSTLDTIVVLPFKEYRRTGHAGGALKCVVRAIPVAVLRPTAGAAEALSYTLLGLRNNLDPDQRRDEEDVWNVEVKE